MPTFVPFAYGFRPFFLLSGCYAVVAMGAWLGLFAVGASPFPGIPPAWWHGHEMLFGFIGAAIAGFMLTAVPSWTGARGFAGWPLAALAAIWLLGRAAFAAAAVVPLPVVYVLELSFLPALMALLAPALVRTSNRNLPLLLVLGALWACDATFLIGLARGDVILARSALLTALNIVLLLITVIAGRIVPAFTTNALRRAGVDVNVRRHALLDRLVIGAMAAMVVVDALRPNSGLSGGLAALAGIAHLLRLVGWHGLRTLREPIVWVLHAAYAWLPLGLLLKAGFLFGQFDWAAFWLHALGAGAAGTMILAVMSRASLGHTGRPLVVGRAVAAAYLLLISAVLVRVFGPAWLPVPAGPAGYRATIIGAGILWVAAFLIFTIVYTPILLRSRVDGKPG